MPVIHPNLEFILDKINKYEIKDVVHELYGDGTFKYNRIAGVSVEDCPNTEDVYAYLINKGPTHVEKNYLLLNEKTQVTLKIAPLELMPKFIYRRYKYKVGVKQLKNRMEDSEGIVKLGAAHVLRIKKLK